MRRAIATMIIAGLALGATAGIAGAVEAGTSEVGIILGRPTGLSVKLWRGETEAFDAAGAWNLENGHFRVHGDYLWHRMGDSETETPPPDMVYYGVGFRFLAGTEEGELGLRLPLGLEHFFLGSPVTLFLEVAPVMSVIPATELDVDYAVGFRYCFR